MRPFTDEEFEIMISELTDEAHSSYVMLCTIAERVLKSKVRYWCATDSVLRGRGMEDDIMQDVFMRLIKTVNNGFLIREDHNWEINRDPDGFKKWIVEVARNIKKDTADALRSGDYRARGFEDGEEGLIPDSQYDDDEEKSLQRERLAESFRIVFDSDKKVYIVLTWLAQSLFMLEYDISKIKSTDFMVKTLSDKTLFEMRDIVLKFAKKIEWINISSEQLDRMNKALHSLYKDEMYGNCKYKDFYMKQGGKKSISDWVNRVNRMIERLM